MRRFNEVHLTGFSTVVQFFVVRSFMNVEPTHRTRQVLNRFRLYLQNKNRWELFSTFSFPLFPRCHIHIEHKRFNTLQAANESLWFRKTMLIVFYYFIHESCFESHFHCMLVVLCFRSLNSTRAKEKKKNDNGHWHVYCVVYWIYWIDLWPSNTEKFQK